MDEIIERIKWLQHNNAIHRRGFNINEATPLLAAVHAVSEAAEVADALIFDKPPIEILNEIADTLGCHLHLLTMLGFSVEDLKQAVLNKLSLRFTVEEEISEEWFQ